MSRQAARAALLAVLLALLASPLSACASAPTAGPTATTIALTASASVAPTDASEPSAVDVDEMVGLVTDRSAAVKIVPPEPVEACVEYGVAAEALRVRTGIVAAPAGRPAAFLLEGLLPDARYAYRVLVRTAGEAEFRAGEARSFQTCRSPGTTFSFTVQADSHRDANTVEALYRLTLANVLAERPDFHFDLGDTFMAEKGEKTQAAVEARYAEERGIFSEMAHSVPLFLVDGNHEGENGWLTGGTAKGLPLWAATARLAGFLNPLPDGFYSGNAAVDPLAGARGAYYSFEWGDALFVVLDPFWNTVQKPTSSEDGWGYTLGRIQYDWFRTVLEGSRAKYRFVFCHNLVGGAGKDARGGAEAAAHFEWGGLNADGTDGFDLQRPGWGAPIHRLMVENDVTAFFHGHDHFYAHQELDGIDYQLVPQPGHPENDIAATAREYGYVGGTLLPPPGHLLVTVGPEGVRVDYVTSVLAVDGAPGPGNGTSIDSYRAA